MKCLSANPGERFQSASSLKAELEREVNNSRSKTQGANSSKHLPRLMEILISISIISILAAILVPNFLRARSQGCLQSCPSNLKNLGTAIEMYSTDSRGKYPKSLDQVTPNYLKVIPTCASAGTWTYTYSTSEDQRVYTIYCRGSYHTTISKANYPQYDSIRGLIEE